MWAYDFVFDACANGQQLKCLTVVDEFSRECLAIEVAGSMRSGRVIEVFEQAGQCSRQSQVSAIRQRTGVCIQGRAALAA
jgi:transposase InsO family protein